MTCLFSVLSFFHIAYVLPQSLQCSMQYVLSNCVMTRPCCTYFCEKSFVCNTEANTINLVVSIKFLVKEIPTKLRRRNHFAQGQKYECMSSSSKTTARQRGKHIKRVGKMISGQNKQLANNIPLRANSLLRINNLWQWRHNVRDGVSNHRHLDCLLNRLFMSTSKKASKLRITGLCGVNFQHKRPVTRKMFPFDDIIMYNANYSQVEEVIGEYVPWHGRHWLEASSKRFRMISFVLTHWGRYKMAAFSQTTSWNAFSWMKKYEFRKNFHWNLFRMV